MTSGFGRVLPSLDWVAETFSEDPSAEGVAALRSQLEEDDANSRAGLTFAVIPANLSQATSWPLVPVASISRTIGESGRSDVPPLLVPGAALRAGYAGRLVLIGADLLIPDAAGEQSAWRLKFRVADRDPFPSGKADPKAQCPEPAFTVEAGSFATQPTTREDVYDFQRHRFSYRVIAWPGAGLQAREIAGMLEQKGEGGSN